MTKDTIVSALEDNLSLQRGFFENLLQEDDWSFIIKLHAFVDAACTDLLLYHFKEPDLRTTLSLLELGNTRTGKIVFLRNLGLTTSEHNKIIRELGKIRNDFAHKVSDAYKTIDEKFAKYDKQQRKNFLDAFSLEGAIVTRLMKNYHGFATLNPLHEDDLKNALKQEYDFKLQIWSGILTLLIHFAEIEGFCDMRQMEKADLI